MSIEGKHSYRFGYLQSDEWKTVRLEALAREKGKCQICGDESLFNDAHHIWYPANIYETKEKHLVILCRICHEFVHVARPECKTKDEEKGRSEWSIFQNAMMKWVASKRSLLNCGPSSIRELRKAYDDLKRQKREIGNLQNVIESSKRLSDQLAIFQKSVDTAREL